MKTIRIEYLFPELCHFYGDHANLTYIAKKAELMGNTAEIIQTSRCEPPMFLKEEIDLVYIGPTTEREQITLIEAIRPYKEELRERIENDRMVLTTGNSLEIYYDTIRMTDGTIRNGLQYFPMEAKRFEGKRYSVNVVGTYRGKKIVGYKNLMSKTVTKHNPYPLFEVIRENGRNVSDSREGIHYRNLYATYLLGPILLQNPNFANEILSLLFREDYRELYLPFEREAHQTRVNEILQDKNPDKYG